MKFAPDFKLNPVGTAPNYAGYTNTLSDAGEVGISLYQENQYSLQNLLFRNINGAAVSVRQSAGSWQHVGWVSNIAVRDSYYGFHIYDTAEYETVSDCNAANCVFGFLVESGNNNFSNCKATYSSIGVKIYGGTNDGHGTWTGLQSCHNTYNLTCHNVANGESFVGCNFIAGQSGSDQGKIQMVNAKGISLIGGQVGFCDITVDATSQLSLRGVTLRGTCNFTVASGGILDAKDTTVVPGSTVTLNGAAWNGIN